MRYDRIKIVEYRDNPRVPPYKSQLASAEADVQALAEQCEQLLHATRQPSSPGSPEDKARKAAQEVLDVVDKKLAARKIDVARLLQLAHKHPKDDSFGYQVVNGAGVVTLVDELGQPFPAEAVFSYSIVGFNVARPDTFPSPRQPYEDALNPPQGR